MYDQFPFLKQQDDQDDYLSKLLSIPGFDPNNQPEQTPEMNIGQQDVKDYLFGNYQIPLAKPVDYVGDTKQQEVPAQPQQTIQPSIDPRMEQLKQQIQMLQKQSSGGPSIPSGENELRKMRADQQTKIGAAQKTESENNLLTGLLRAGLTTGAAIGGTKADYEGVDALDKTNKAPVQAVQAKEKSLLDFQKLIQDEKLREEQMFARKEMAKIANEAKKLQFGEKEDQFTTNKALAFQKSYREDLASGRSGAGIAQRKLQLAQDLKALIPKSEKEMDQLPDEMLKEIALSFTAMLSPSGVPAVRIVEGMTPKTMKTYIGKNLSKITGNPEPTNSHEYVKMFDKALDRQIDVNAEQLTLQKLKAITPVLQDPMLKNHPIIKSLSSQEGFTDKQIEDVLAGKMSVQGFAEKIKNENKQLSNDNASGFVKVKLPNGKEGRIPAEKLEDAKKLGAVEI